ncbi:peptidoglycan-binding domain-containing protein [Streptomyces lycii]|uniref:Peptidoglycan-binding protein n=1 Tax=Streptomyces lycii TaxID=2654337 RepID=A0ABQ7FA12_9ACTN|nr:peptidoglycan-binding domain-containing protein [Streptomyces lycii]KAF4405864.1 peptidoglycan-binding protein [Streptomyces lycii]
MNASKRIALVTATLALTGGVFSTPASADSASATASQEISAAAYTCDVERSGNTYQAGYYSGRTITPSTRSVSAAGIEAQCILKHRGYDPGTVDGVFGPNSQAAMKELQRDVNDSGAGLVVDGLPGPKSWGWLRVFGW